MWAYSGTGLDSASVSGQIFVYPTPVANFQMYVLNPLTGSDTVQFADNSLFADSWIWNFGDPASGSNNTSTLQNPLHVFSANSTYEITLTVSNANGCTSTISNSTSVNVGLSEEQPNRFNVQLFPNPAHETLTIVFETDRSEVRSLSITDVTGRQVSSSTVSAVIGMNRFSIPIKALADGAYFLRLEGNGPYVSRPFIVSHR
jgi:PKD repeat protein